MFLIHLCYLVIWEKHSLLEWGVWSVVACMALGLFPAYDWIFCHILHGESNLLHGNIIPHFIMILNFQVHKMLKCSLFICIWSEGWWHGFWLCTGFNCSCYTVCVSCWNQFKIFVNCQFILSSGMKQVTLSGV